LFAGAAPRLELNLPLNQTPSGGAWNAMTVLRDEEIRHRSQVKDGQPRSNGGQRRYPDPAGDEKISGNFAIAAYKPDMVGLPTPLM